MLQNGITLLLDGRHRFRAARELGINCPAVLLPADEDPAAFVIRANLITRRHLTALDRAKPQSLYTNGEPKAAPTAR